MTLNLLKQYAEELGDAFPQNCGNLGVASQYQLPIKVIQKYVEPKSTKILDWGCGEGHFSYLLLRLCFDVYSFSFDQDKIQTAQQRIRTHLHQEWKVKQSSDHDPVHIPYEDACFDAVVSMGVLEHVRETGGNESASLAEIYRLLRPGGIFFCFHFPNRYSWIEMVARKQVALGAAKFTHEFLYTKRAVKELILPTSFKILEMGRYNLFPRRFLRRFPIMHTPGGYTAYRALERVMATVFSPFSQNHYFVLQK